MLQVENLSVSYAGDPPVKAVDGISFSLPVGKTTVLIGPSGSGKSAIAAAILNVLPQGSISSGTISYATGNVSPSRDLPLSDLTPKQRGQLIAWVSQDAQRGLSPTRTIGSLLLESARFHLRDLTTIDTRIAALLSELDLTQGVLTSFPHQLSGGQRQRCLLALALIRDPKILIADEPTTALDVLREAHLIQVLKRLQQQRQLTTLLITHDQYIADTIGDHFLYLNGGQLTTKQESESLDTFSPTRPPSSSAPILTVSNLSASYPSRGGFLRAGQDIQALTDVSFMLRAGEILGMAGESGSGKSSLANCLMGLIPFQGSVEVNGAPSTRIQLVMQDSYSSLHPRFTIGQNLRESMRVWHKDLSRSQQTEGIIALLHSVQISASYLSKYPGELSGGERQRVSIARALIPTPNILILDESISSLDQHLQLEMIKLIQKLIHLHDLSLILISHDLRILSTLCHRILVLFQGKVIESNTPEAIIHSPVHPHTQDLLKASGLPFTESSACD